MMLAFLSRVAALEKHNTGIAYLGHCLFLGQEIE